MPHLRSIRTNDQPVYEGFLSAHRWHGRDKRDDISTFCSINRDENCAANFFREDVPGAPRDTFLIYVEGPSPNQNGYLSCHNYYRDRDVRDRQSCWLNVFDDQRRGALFRQHDSGRGRMVFEIVGSFGDQPVETGWVACHDWYKGRNPEGSGPDMRDGQSCYLHNNKDRNCATEFEAVGGWGGGWHRGGGRGDDRRDDRRRDDRRDDRFDRDLARVEREYRRDDRGDDRRDDRRGDDRRDDRRRDDRW